MTVEARQNGHAPRAPRTEDDARRVGGARRDSAEAPRRRFVPLRVLFAWLLRRRPSSSLTRRILAINLLVLAVPVGGFFFLDQYQESLVDAEIEALRIQGEVFAAAIGAGAVLIAPGIGQQVDPVRASLMLRRLTAPTQTRARLFSADGALIVDTQALVDPRGLVRVRQIPPPDGFAPWIWARDRFESLLNWLPSEGELPIYQEHTPQHASDYR